MNNPSLNDHNQELNELSMHSLLGLHFPSTKAYIQRYTIFCNQILPHASVMKKYKINLCCNLLS